MKDFYYILGVDANCTLTDIKEAYRKLSKKFHPDVNQGDDYFDNRFKDINEAYFTLSDPEKRNRYDIELEKYKLKQTSPQGNYKRHTQRAKPSAFNLSRSRRPGTAILITIAVVILVFGAYMVQSFSHTKKRVLLADNSIASVPVKVHHHHKRHYHLKNKTIAGFAKIKTDSVAAKPVLAMAKSKIPAQPAENKLPLQTVVKSPVTSPKAVALPVAAAPQPDFPYIAFVRPNATGFVNMRKFDNYSSAVIGTIPANSKVSVLARGAVYYKVAYNNSEGYVPKWALQDK
jgi:hypothetical protein